MTSMSRGGGSRPRNARSRALVRRLLRIRDMRSASLPCVLSCWCILAAGCHSSTSEHPDGAAGGGGAGTAGGSGASGGAGMTGGAGGASGPGGVGGSTGSGGGTGGAGGAGAGGGTTGGAGGATAGKGGGSGGAAGTTGGAGGVGGAGGACTEGATACASDFIPIKCNAAGTWENQTPCTGIQICNNGACGTTCSPTRPPDCIDLQHVRACVDGGVTSEACSTAPSMVCRAGQCIPNMT